MKHLNFALHQIDSLGEQLSGGFVRLSLVFAAHGRPISVKLWRSDGTGIRVRCRMYDVAERVEHGVLEFEPLAENGGDDAVIDLPDDMHGKCTVAKLVLNDDGVVCESGLVIRGSRGGELIVVAGVYPHTLAVNVAKAFGPFEPEYPMEKYARVENV
ncbi:hypothetical protein VSR82_35735 [Burkholderia sp. JPY481]|uniref:hypothetical protein n=1 Tax=Paraburkholderia sp. JPY465 TaxID=3042285 RepID=UPI00317DE883